MTITVTHKLYEVGVFPTYGQYQNVVARVSWGVEYEQEGFCTHHADFSMLPVDNIQAFIPIEQLTKEQVIAWCIENKGGDAYMQGLLLAHAHQLKEKISQKDIKTYREFPIDRSPAVIIPPLTIPVEVL